MAITDLTGYTWVGNDATEPGDEGISEKSINFTSNGTNFTALNGVSTRWAMNLYYDSTLVWSDTGWSNENYKTMKITGGADVTNAELITFLDTYGTLTPPPKIDFDLTTLSLSEGTHNLKVKATGTGYRDSEFSNIVQYTVEPPMPTKGQIINLNMDGTSRQYRVLTINGNEAEVVAMFDPNTNCTFDISRWENTYNGSELDTYLNTTWYGGLTATAKDAIVSKTLTQYQYAYNIYSYDADAHASYVYYSTKSVKESGLSRNVYALDVDDIENYFNNTFSKADIWELFWNVRSKPSTVTYPWLRSADNSGRFNAWVVDGEAGCVDIEGVGSSYAARPAFTIDLSKITWS